MVYLIISAENDEAMNQTYHSKNFTPVISSGKYIKIIPHIWEVIIQNLNAVILL